MTALGSLDLRYSATGPEGPDAWHTAAQQISHPHPHVRLAAVQLLSQLCQQQGAAARQADVDAAFLLLCCAISTEHLASIRLQAVQGLAGIHQASTAVKLQALSKRADLTALGGASAAAAAGAMRASGAAAPAPLLLSPAAQQAATGAFVCATEDDTLRVRLAAVAALASLANHDAAFLNSAAQVMTNLAADELPNVRLAALGCLVAWAEQCQQRHHARQQQGQQQDERAAGQSEGGQQQAMQLDAAQQGTATAAGASQDLEDAAAASAAAAGEDDEEEAAEEGELVSMETDAAAWQQQQQQQRVLASPAAAGRRGQQGGKPGRTKGWLLRKHGLPVWCQDGLGAAVAALRDSSGPQRLLALRLLGQLLPLNSHDLLQMMSGLAAACERYQQQREQEIARALARDTGLQRAEVVGRTGKLLVQQLARALAAAATASEAAAAATTGAGARESAAHDGDDDEDGADAAAAGDYELQQGSGGDWGVAGFQRQHQQQQPGASGGEAAAPTPLPEAVALLLQLLCAAGAARPQILPGLRTHMRRARLLWQRHQAVLLPLLQMLPPAAEGSDGDADGGDADGGEDGS